jgi:predicted adenine nucleotide alpha hydrolase (AANH) superfamily ATPase
LVHVCCAPCATLPVCSWLLRRPRPELRLWFYNPNIQPAEEFRRRRDAVAFLVLELKNLVPDLTTPLPVDFSPPYEPSEFLAAVAETPQAPDRCRACCRLRLRAAAIEAKALGLAAFTTTLLYSRRQRHGIIKEEGFRAAVETGVEFHYEDFRDKWREGVELGRRLSLYRQRWCGCVYEAR